jgi:chromosome partitioning protein
MPIRSLHMDGDKLRQIREARNETQESFAATLNRIFSRRYDKSRVSRWETGSEPIPVDVSNMLYTECLTYEPKNRCMVLSTSLRKGGTGKSTITSALGFLLSKVKCGDRSCRVLCIDCDSQANLSLALGIDRDRIDELDAVGRTFYHVVMGRTPIADAVQKTGIPGLDIIASSVSLAFAERELLTREIREDIPANHALRDIMTDEFKRGYDFILLDCMPSLGITTLNALCASDRVLYAVQVESYAVVGMDHLTEIIATVRKGSNPDLRTLGVVPTMYSNRLSQDRASLDDIRRKATIMGVPVFEPLPRSTLFPQAAAANVVLYNVDRSAPGLQTFVEIAEALGVQTIGGING